MTASSADGPASRRPVRWRTVAVLALAGGAAFWIANFAISLTPIAAEYRAALSISYVPMLLEALAGGLVLGFGVSMALIRFADRVPGRNSLQKALLLSLVALAVATVVIELPAKMTAGIPDPVRYLVIGTVFNTIRILALGLVVGVVAGRREPTNPTANDQDATNT